MKFQREPAHDRVGHSLRVKEAGLAAHLGLFESGFCVLEQRIGVGTVIREHRYSNLSADMKSVAIDLERMLQQKFQRPFEMARELRFVPDGRKYYRKMVRIYAR